MFPLSPKDSTLNSFIIVQRDALLGPTGKIWILWKTLLILHLKKTILVEPEPNSFFVQS